MNIEKPGTTLFLLLMGFFSIFWLSLLALHYYELGQQATLRPPSSDFYKFYLSAQRTDQGLSMYWLVPPRLKKGDPCHPDTTVSLTPLDRTPGRLNLGGDLPCLGPNLNPPIFIAAIRPLSGLPYPHAWWIWSALSIGSTILLGALISAELKKSTVARISWTAILCALFLTYYPSIANFSLGQLGAVLTLLIYLSWATAHKPNRDWISGFWLGLVLSVKPIFGILWLCIFISGRTKIAISSAITTTLITGIGLLIYGHQSYSDYFQLAKNIHWTASNWNASWVGLFDRAFSGQVNSQWPEDRFLSKTLGTTAALLTLVTSSITLLHIKFKHPTYNATHAAFIIGIPATLLIAPLGWLYYFPTMFVSTVATFQLLKGQQLRHTGLGLLLLFVLTSVPMAIKGAPSPENPTHWFSLDSWYCLGLALTWFAGILGVTHGGSNHQNKGQSARFL